MLASLQPLGTELSHNKKSEIQPLEKKGTNHKNLETTAPKNKGDEARAYLSMSSVLTLKTPPRQIHPSIDHMLDTAATCIDSSESVSSGPLTAMWSMPDMLITIKQANLLRSPETRLGKSQCNSLDVKFPQTAGTPPTPTPLLE